MTADRGPVWLEVALNGPWSRERQPLIPVAAEEVIADGVACARAGAAILHLHAYDPATGRQNDDPDTYARIVEGIRAEVDAVVYPTLPLAGSPDAPRPMPAAERFAAVESLCHRGTPIEWSVVDPGSVHMVFRADLEADREGFAYLNPESHVRHGLALCARHGLVPSYAIYEPGFLRLGAALARRVQGCLAPVYRLMFSDDMAWGFPPLPFALDAYRELLALEAPGAPWMVAGLGVDVRPLILDAVARGGHVRVGLEDAPLGTALTNLDWVRAAADLVADAGGRLATAADVRAATTSRTSP